MVRAYRLSSTVRVAVLVGGLVALGCARVANPPLPITQDGGPIDVRRLSDAILLTCGNGHLDQTEQCDDGNTTPGDGCNQLCQQEGNWECMTPGQPCVFIAVCGNGILTSDEACDDGNKVSGDGCSADCKTVEPGWQCRVPGKKCVTLCGDGVKTATETCDDGNAVSGDGCSSTCLTEPGATCSTPGQPCIKSVCGNGKIETGESCDAGDKNGLFFGDGTGCTKTCTKEPICRDASGHNQACAVTCGDGNQDTTEQCDDGNLADGDGCDHLCHIEGGFTCTPQPHPDTQACSTDPTQQCLRLPITYRDFKSEHEVGGHPDFYFLGTMDPTTAKVKRFCVPNSGGPAKKNDSTSRCWGIAQANLLNGKPVGSTPVPLCECQFSDYSAKTNGGHVPGYVDAQVGPLRFKEGVTLPAGETLVYVGQDGIPSWHGTVPAFQDATSFSQWFTDTNLSIKSQGVLELSAFAGGTNQYRFSSPPHSVLGGFFPVDPPGTPAPPGTVRSVPVSNEPLLCNLWPYWFPQPWGPLCMGDQYLFPPSVDATTPGCMTPGVGMLPCANGTWVPLLQGFFHNSWYSTEARYLFAYNPPMSLQFYGDDDLFIFVNGIEVLDLGGVHQRLPGSVTIDGPTGTATIIEGGSLNPVTGAINPCPTADPVTLAIPNATGATVDCRNRTVALNLTAGQIYEIAVFHADRHPTESNYQLTLSGFSTNRSNCQPRCGDGLVSAGEECDCGDGTGPLPAGCDGPNADGVYGGCTKACKFGPFCGDNIVNGPEMCDLGRNNGTTSGAAGCTYGCTRHYCGDGVPDPGEGCDLGPLNGQPGQLCSSTCVFVIP